MVPRSPSDCTSDNGGDTEGTGTFVTMLCQSNHMKWNTSMILAISIGFLGVSSIIWGAIANRAGRHYSLSVLLRRCSGPLCTSSIKENICDWRTHSVLISGKRKPSFSRRDAALSTNNPLLDSARSKSRSTAKNACVCMVDMTETCGREIPLSRLLEFVAW